MVNPDDDVVIEEGLQPVAETVSDTGTMDHGGCCHGGKEEESHENDPDAHDME